jgi:serine/threonine protein kinase
LPTTNLEVGKTVGDYEIIALLGHGGMGQVFKVRNVISDRVDAMKSLLSYGDGDSEKAERFIREIKVLAKLEHPNITSFRTAFRVNEELLMIMEYVEGSSLSRKLLQRLEPETAVDYACQVLSALGHAHQCGVLHRDVKPSNILIGTGDRVKLTDFGIASLIADPGLTITGGTVGTLYYMAPEQMKALPIDGRADLYSLGATLYEMITGRVPFKGDSYYSVLKANLERKAIWSARLFLPVNLFLICRRNFPRLLKNRWRKIRRPDSRRRMSFGPLCGL